MYGIKYISAIEAAKRRHLSRHRAVTFAETAAQPERKKPGYIG